VRPNDACVNDACVQYACGAMMLLRHFPKRNKNQQDRAARATALAPKKGPMRKKSHHA
jgi:hypothetical protein